jgi:glycosyltransferase involved in cell wall biosynthesis
LTDVTVVIPSIPPRAGSLHRAIQSITAQTFPAAAIVVEVDNHRTGAAATRHRGLTKVDTEWTAFIDDDDLWDPNHLEVLRSCADEYGADYVWSRFRILYPDGRTLDGPTPLGARSFSQWDDNHPAQTTITTLVRTELALKAGGFEAFTDDPDRLIDGQRFGEDFDFTLRMRSIGAVFRHAPVVTWSWRHHGKNTSGRSDGW